MRILVVNAGSSSLKMSLLDSGHDSDYHPDYHPGCDSGGEQDCAPDWDYEMLAAMEVERWAGEEDVDPVAAFVKGLGGIDGIDAVGHRVVHGGTEFTAPTLIDNPPGTRSTGHTDGASGTVYERLAALTTLAPLHQPRSLAAIAAVRTVLPDRPAVACFDTAFHATIPASAATYALPWAWRQTWPLRRFGFHGLSHAYASRRAARILGRQVTGLRLVTCHLGAGASLCAVRDGRSVDTTMGFTPLEGLAMMTRSGSVDPGLVLWLLSEGGLTVDQVQHGLEKESGLAGLAGGSGDVRDVLAAANRGDARATLALEVFLHRLRREIGAMVTVLGGLDGLVFTGRIGERSARIRAAAVAELAFLGARLDAERNAEATGDADVSAPDATVRTIVVTAREDVEIARQVRTLLA